MEESSYDKRYKLIEDASAPGIRIPLEVKIEVIKGETLNKKCHGS